MIVSLYSVMLCSLVINIILIELKDAFDVFDADKSGDISAKELKNVLKSLDLDNSDAEVKKLLESMDRNGDGSISFAGLLQFYIKNAFRLFFFKFLFRLLKNLQKQWGQNFMLRNQKMI